MTTSAAQGEVAGNDPEAALRVAVAGGRLREAIDLLMDRHGDAIHRFCRAMLKSPDQAADVHQVVFIAAHDSLSRGDEVGDFAGWLLGIARHRCLDALKARRRWYARFGFSTAAARTAPSEAAAADDRIAKVQRGAALLDCLEALPVATRNAVVMRFDAGLSFEQMARLCGDHAGTLQARVARAMPGLRQCLERKGWGEP